MNDSTVQDRRWLDAAVRMARPLLGTTGDSPTVGALVVDEGGGQQLLARAATHAGGWQRAEVQALSNARGSARGATLYLTLEPCGDSGPARPSTDAIIEAGIGRVVIGMLDPDPVVCGRGVMRLRQSGVEVVHADHEPSRLLHESHIMRKTRRRPFVTAKLAVSRDGMIGLPGAALAAPITGGVASRWTQMQRALSDAVMVGSGAARIEDPSLTVDLPGLERRGHARVVLAGVRPLAARLNLIAGVSGFPTVIIAERERRLDVPPQVQVIGVEGNNGRPDLRRAMSALHARGIGRLLVEGGAKLTEALIAAELVDRFHLLSGTTEIGRKGVPATMLGGIDGRLRAAGFTEVDRQALGVDMLQTFERAL